MHFISLNFDYKGLVQDTLIGTRGQKRGLGLGLWCLTPLSTIF
jgi:hypothetical protein